MECLAKVWKRDALAWVTVGAYSTVSAARKALADFTGLHVKIVCSPINGFREVWERPIGFPNWKKYYLKDG